MTQWRDDHGYRRYCHVTQTVGVVDEPEVARTDTPEIDRVVLEELLTRCRGGGAARSGAVTGAPSPQERR